MCWVMYIFLVAIANYRILLSKRVLWFFSCKMQLVCAEFSAGFCLFSPNHPYNVIMLFVVGFLIKARVVVWISDGFVVYMDEELTVYRLRTEISWWPSDLSPLVVLGSALRNSLYFQKLRYSDSLPTERSGDRIPVAARFSVLVHTSPGAHPASYTMSTGSLSRG